MGTFFFGGFEILFFIVFFLILGVILVSVIRGIAQWNQNNHSPRLTVRAAIVSKRLQVSHHHAADGVNSSSFTHYYVTFQVESGDRMELQVNGREYGILAEGDCGNLTFQGTRYLSFERMT